MAMKYNMGQAVSRPILIRNSMCAIYHSSFELKVLGNSVLAGALIPANLYSIAFNFLCKSLCRKTVTKLVPSANEQPKMEAYIMIVNMS